MRVYQFNGVFTVHNAGPAAAIGGSFTFGAQLGFLEGAIDNALRPVTASAPFGACTVTPGVTAGHLTVTCPFTVFPPGATATVSITTVVNLPADQSPAGVYQMDVTWTVKSYTAGSTYSGTPDRTRANDTQSEFVNVCGPKATDPNGAASP